MKKFAIFIFFVTLLVSGGLLYYQWNEKDVAAVTNYKTSAEVSYENNQFHIKQKFENINQEKVVLQIPSNATNITGEYASGKALKFVNATQLLTIQLEEPEFTLSYNYNHYTTGTSQLLSAPFFSINNNPNGKIALSIYDSTQNFSWVFDGELLGSTTRDAFDLTMYWDGKSTNDLYFTRSDLSKVYDKEDVTVFASQGVRKFGFAKMLEKAKSFNLVPEHAVIIIENGLKKPIYGEQTMVISNEANSSKMEASMIRNSLQQQYAFESRTKTQVVNLLTALILQQQPSDKKLASMYRFLEENYTTEDIKNWIHAVLADKEKVITSKLLDEQFGVVQNKATQYFTLNLMKKTYVPFFESLDLKLSYRKEALDYTGILYNKRTYYPMELFRSLGFQVKDVDAKTLMLTYEGNTWELRTDRNVFQFNDEYLEISRSPITRIAGDLYIEQYWLTELFKIRFVIVGDHGEVVFNP